MTRMIRDAQCKSHKPNTGPTAFNCAMPPLRIALSLRTKRSRTKSFLGILAARKLEREEKHRRRASSIFFSPYGNGCCAGYDAINVALPCLRERMRACYLLSDSILFLLRLYPVDMKRVNEFGVSYGDQENEDKPHED